MGGTVQKERILYLDFLRAISVVGVMLIHFTAKCLGSPDIGEPGWWIFLIFNCLGRFAVPVYFMISGSLFLNPDRECDIKKLYLNNIAHLAAAFAFWSTWYVIADFLPAILQGEALTFQGVKDMIKAWVLGPTHFWFLYALIALYMLVPFLKKIAGDKRLLEYFLFLWFLFSIVNATTKTIPGFGLVTSAFSQFKMNFVSGYVGYFVLGYYCRFYFAPDKKQRRVIYGLGIAGYVVMILGTNALSVRLGYYSETLVGATQLHCLAMVIAVFTAARAICERFGKSCVFTNIIGNIASQSFGIYLIHMLVFDAFRFGLGSDVFGYSAVGVLLTVTIVYVVCWGLSFGVHKIPVLGKWIV